MNVDGKRSLVRTGTRDLARATATNALVTRTLGDLAQIESAHDAAYYAERGLLALTFGDLDNAISNLDLAIQLNPEHSFAYRIRGIAWARKGDHDMAIEDFGQTIRIEPEYSAAYESRANSWMAKGEFVKALHDYSAVIRGIEEGMRADPDLKRDFCENIASDYLNRGVAWECIGNYDKAIEDFDEAISADPKYAAPHNHRGLICLKKSNYDEAIEEFGQAIRLAPDIGVYHYNRGSARLTQGEYEHAINNFSEAIRLDPMDADFYAKRGRAWFSKRDYEAAIRDFEEANRLRQSTGRESAESPCTLAIAIPGEVIVRPLPGGTKVVLAETPETIVVSKVSLAQAFERARFQRRKRFDKLHDLNAPEVILQNEIQIMRRCKAAWTSAGNRPDYFAYYFKAAAGFLVSGTQLDSLANLTEWEGLEFPKCSSSNEALAHLCNFRKLRDLQINDCDAVTDDGLEHIAALGQLEVLDLAGCSITDQGLPRLYGLNNLQVCSVSRCDMVTGAGVSMLKAALPQCDIN